MIEMVTYWLIIEILAIFFAGWGAGVVTGLIGASAVVIVFPILCIFLGYDPYVAQGIGLTTDVIASLVAVHIYKKHGNIDLKSGLQMTVAAIIAAQLGSWLSSLIEPAHLSWVVGTFILVMGVSFIRSPLSITVDSLQDKIVSTFNQSMDSLFFQKKRSLSSILYYLVALCYINLLRRKYLPHILFGAIIGLICGFTGAGGGVMILLVLTFILGYKIHIAVGTSVLMMALIAFSGALGHALFVEIPWPVIVISCIGGAIGARSASIFANLTSEERLGRIAGSAFAVLGLMMIAGELT